MIGAGSVRLSNFFVISFKLLLVRSLQLLLAGVKLHLHRHISIKTIITIYQSASSEFDVHHAK